MGICEVLTVIFVICKILGIIGWNWFFVLLPEIIAFAFYAVVIIGSVCGFNHTSKKMKKHFDKFDF